MKVLGLTCGRKNSNTEILVKEALMGAEETGAEVEIVRLLDLKIKPCTGCNSCVIDLMEKGGSGKCVIKDDDLAFIDEKIMECDGFILGSPIYEKMPQGLLKVLNDRFGPSHDMAIRLIAKKIREEKGITKGTGPDERAFKPRVASLIAVGGSDWTTLALPLLNIFTLPFQMKVVDQILVDWTALPATVLLNDKAIERARKSGRHVAESLKNPVEEAAYIGEQGMCPVCHTKVLHIEGSTSKVVCATCGVIGTLKVNGDKVEFVLTEEEAKHSHMLLSGKFMHVEDMGRTLAPKPGMDTIPQKLEKYKSYLKFSKP
ncbi:MAG: flavodoxin family protein [Spirochaetes bacterium]|nr:flavodoxin family protein [Spirochaetota bacterium]